MDEERQLSARSVATVRELDHRHLPDSPHALDPAPHELAEGHLHGLQRHHPRGQRRLDLGAAQRGVEAAGGDLDLRQLGHGCCG